MKLTTLLCLSNLLVVRTEGFHNLHYFATSRQSCDLRRVSRLSQSSIDFQSDVTKFGRGEMHLSAILEEGDVVVYQTGTWYVDGVEVGDGTPATFRYALVENVQIVWTHNCEHGVVRGLSLKLQEKNSKQQFVRHGFEEIEFGPEQLVARIPVKWESEDEKDVCTPLVELKDELWQNDMGEE